ncbi:MAG: hypothetical protein ABIT83_12625 [Massilia sp.]
MWVQNLSNAETNGEFKASLRALFSMPGRGFLQRYQEISLASVNFMWSLPQSLPLAQLEHAIRVRLECICQVVREYDREGSGVGYGGNVMLYVDTTGSRFASAVVLAALQERTVCIETGVAITNLAGVLDLQLPLSIRSTGSFSPDTNLTAMALPIPRRPPNESATRRNVDNVIPGAPYAFVSEQALVFCNQHELVNKVASNRLFSSVVLHQLSEVVAAQAAHVQALICIPLYGAARPEAGHRAPIGIVNIHRNQPDPHATAKFEYLAPLLVPLAQSLGNLVEQLPWTAILKTIREGQEYEQYDHHPTQHHEF